MSIMPESTTACTPSQRKLPAWLRWSGVVARGAHLVAVVILGASVLGAPVGGAAAGTAALVTGLVMLALDIRQRPGHLRELAGATMLAKIGLVAWMVADDGVRVILFWLVVGISGIVAHAPAYFRHIPLFPDRRHGSG